MKTKAYLIISLIFLGWLVWALVYTPSESAEQALTAQAYYKQAARTNPAQP